MNDFTFSLAYNILIILLILLAILIQVSSNVSTSPHRHLPFPLSRSLARLSSLAPTLSVWLSFSAAHNMLLRFAFVLCFYSLFSVFVAAFLSRFLFC